MSEDTPKEHDPETEVVLGDMQADHEQGALGELDDYLSRTGSRREIAETWHGLKRGRRATGSRDQVAQYRLEREIGRGGQAVVWLARDERLDRPVALKLLRGLGAESGSVLARFRREATITSRLDHPVICPVFEVGFDDVPFIAMRYVEGRTLAQRIHATDTTGSSATEASEFMSFGASEDAVGGGEDGRDGGGASSLSATSAPGTSREVGDVLHLLEKVARGLHVAHEAGVVHRDVKPGNIMVTPDGEPVILDFGLAHAEESDATLTMTGDTLGTPAYMSPEQIASKHVSVDRRTDVYSLAVTLYEALSGRRPFTGHSRERLYQAILTETPDPVRKLNPALGADLSVVVETAMQKNPAERYQTAEEFAEELRRVRVHEPIVARPAGPWKRTLRWARRNPAIATMLLLLITTLGTGLGVSLMQNRQLERQSLDLERESAARGAALEEKAEALREFERLADAQRVAAAEREARLLWPARPRHLDALRAWLDRYRPLRDRRERHRETLAALRAGARPYDEAARLDEHAGLIAEKKLFESQIEAIENALEEIEDDGRASKMEDLVESLQTNLERVERKIAKRSAWVFPGDDVTAWRHDIMTRLLERLDAFFDPREGTYANVEKRAERAKNIEARTVGAWRKEWSEVSTRVASGPRYDGLHLEPVVGLVPLGPDPESGLEEFLHLESHEGDVPSRRDDGRIAMEASTGIILVLVPGGVFFMGAQRTAPDAPNYDRDAVAGENPVHAVELQPYFIGKYEVTQAQWARLAGNNPSDHHQKDSEGKVVEIINPVESIDWNQATRVLGRFGLQLPTEAQWERACRAGTSTPYWTGETVEELEGAANIADVSKAALEAFSTGWDPEPGFEDGFGSHAPVGSFRANPWGLHDVHGNVWEWCRDSRASYDVPPMPDTGLRDFSPRWPIRSYRGGGAPARARFSRSAARSYNRFDWNYTWLGVRAALDHTPEEDG